MSELRRWAGYAEKGKERYITIDVRRRMMKFRGCREENIRDVHLIEDPAGEYMGWIATGEDAPQMIRTVNIFPIQFPGAYQELEAAGRGEAVRLSIEEA